MQTINIDGGNQQYRHVTLCGEVQSRQSGEILAESIDNDTKQRDELNQIRSNLVAVF
jgi:imidazole glycerol phosphate synthase subunit HisF